MASTIADPKLPQDLEAEFGRAESLLKRACCVEAIACAREILKCDIGNDRALDLIERAEKLMGVEIHQLAADEWSTGTVIDDRWIVFGSARGGMGHVYFVRDKAWDYAELAVKSLLEPAHATEAVRARARARFRREAKIWLDLGAHPHIVSGYYTLEIQGRLRFFMEFVPGNTLKVVAQTGALPMSRVLDFAIQLASGLAYVHERGIVHRDLKPANCMVMADDTIRIADFGLGKSLDELEVDVRANNPFAITSLSAHGAGTPHYMAPEQWGSLAAAAGPADVYAVGVILWELLASRRPFEPSPACLSAYASISPAISRIVARGALSPERLLQLMHAELPPLSLQRLGLAIPTELDDLILACLSKRPDQRPTATVLCEQLVRTYSRTVGHLPTRPMPAAVEATAGGDNNRALSYEVMGERPRAISILDSALTRERLAPYPWVNRAVIAIEEGTQPCVVSARVVSELLPAHPELFDDSALRPVLDRLSRFFQQCPPVMALDATAAIRAVGCEGQVMIFDATTGQVLQSHDVSDIVLGIACLGDTRVAAADGNEIVMFSVSNQPLSRLKGHRDLVTALAVSQDERKLASASSDGTIAIWDADTGALVHRMTIPELARFVTWHPSGEVIVTTTTGEVYAVHPARGLELLASRVMSCTAIASDGAIVIGGRDGMLTSHRSLGGGLRGVTDVRVLGTHAGAVVAIHAAAGLIASADERGQVRVWGPAGLVAEAPAFPGRIRGLRIASDGSEIAIGSEAGAIHIWTLLSTKAWPRTIQRDLPALEKQRRADEVTTVVIRLSAGDMAALADVDSIRERYPEYRRDGALLSARHHLITNGGLTGELAGDTSDACSVWTSRLPGRAIAMAWAPDGRIAVSTPVGVEILDARTGATIGRLPFRASAGLGFAGTHVFLADSSGALLCTDLRGQVQWSRRWSDTGDLRAAAYASGVVVGGGWSRETILMGGSLRLWSLTDQEEVELMYVGHTISSVAISSDASVVAVGLDDGRSMVWAVDCSKVVHTGRGTCEVTAIALSLDLRYVAVGHKNGETAVWLIAEPSVVVRTRARSAIVSLSFSADGRWLCSSARDGRVVVVEVPSLRRIVALHAHAHPAFAAISPSGEMITTASEDGMARMWRMVVDWSSSDYLLGELERRIATLSAPDCVLLDVALDAWSELSRLRSLPTLPTHARRRAHALASTVAEWLRTNVHVVPVTSTTERLRGAYARALAVDAELSQLWSSAGART